MIIKSPIYNIYLRVTVVKITILLIIVGLSGADSLFLVFEELSDGCIYDRLR